MTSSPAIGIDKDGVEHWLAERAEVVGALSFDLVTHGRSNLTFIVSDDADSQWVLRRPPTGKLLASAHDMGREHSIMAALADTDVPVPAMVGMCSDESVTGAPFFVMEFVVGSIIKNLIDTEPFNNEARRRQSESLVDVLAALHNVDPDHVGLGDLGKKSDYVERQLRRWNRQVTDGSERDLPLFFEMHDLLAARVPAQQGAGITHGDYRLDNTMIGADNKVAAVLDWELCTLGDVLADVGGMVLWWGDPTTTSKSMREVPTLASGYLSPADVIERYAGKSERDLSDIGFYIAFQGWRLAAILEGVRVRFASGSMGDKDIGDEAQGYATRIDALLEDARSALGA